MPEGFPCYHFSAMNSIDSEIPSRLAAGPRPLSPPSGLARTMTTHRIRRTFALSPLLHALSRPRTALKAVSLALTVLRYFFYPQFETRFFPRKRPVVSVDHPLDETVPFRPDLVAEYLTFFFLWINTGLFFARNYGKPGRLAFSRYIDAVKGMYRDCGSVYLRRQSTTKRPPEAANSFFALIHSLDPHLHCVPSLHILVVLGNWLYASRTLAELAGGKGGLREERALAYLRQEAVRITESVLFVKQHSVNCIGASLFYLKVRYPEFDSSAVDAFLGELFSYEGVDLGAKDRIRDHARTLCARLWDSYRARPEMGWRRPILSFLGEFEPHPPFGPDR